MFVAINFSALCWGALKEYESIHETGATGNIGLEVGHFLSKLNFKSEILAAVLHIEKMKAFFKKYPDPFLHHFDYKVEDDETKVKIWAIQQVNERKLLPSTHQKTNDKVYADDVRDERLKKYKRQKTEELMQLQA